MLYLEFISFRDGVPDQKLPKYRHCRNGGVWPLPRFLWRICPHALRALKGDHSSPKSDNFPTKVFLFPRNHINLTFSLSKMIYALLSKNVTSRIYAILWAKSPKRKLLSLSFIIPLWTAEPLTAKKKRKKAETHVSCPWFYKTKKMKGHRR